jgi:tetrahydromethanopterin S-methyltransferase subunit F
MIVEACEHEGICAAFRKGIIIGFVLASCLLLVGPQISSAKETKAQDAGSKKDRGELSWELPGRVSIYDLQLGPAVLKDNRWQFIGNNRTLNAGRYGERLTLMVRFSYSGSGSEVPIKFVIKLPGSRPYEETVHLASRRGNYSYQFTIHRPEDFVGSGSVYLYYGFSIVDVLDFTIVPGT